MLSTCGAVPFPASRQYVYFLFCDLLHAMSIRPLVQYLSNFLNL